MKLVIESVGRQYSDKVWGLRDFSLELGPGVLGLLGPNGLNSESKNCEHRTNHWIHPERYTK